MLVIFTQHEHPKHIFIPINIYIHLSLCIYIKKPIQCIERAQTFECMINMLNACSECANKLQIVTLSRTQNVFTIIGTLSCYAIHNYWHMNAQPNKNVQIVMTNCAICWPVKYALCTAWIAGYWSSCFVYLFSHLYVKL